MQNVIWVNQDKSGHAGSIQNINNKLYWTNKEFKSCIKIYWLAYYAVKYRYNIMHLPLLPNHLVLAHGHPKVDQQNNTSFEALVHQKVNKGSSAIKNHQPGLGLAEVLFVSSVCPPSPWKRETTGFPLLGLHIRTSKH